jgi:hypothetical protein
VDDVLTISRPEAPAGRPPVLPAILVGALLVVALVVISFGLRTPEMVNLTVDNQSEWRAEVSVRSADSTAWTGAGGVARENSLEFLELPDQGSDWVIRFSYGGVSEEVPVSRDELAAQNWTIEVPASFATMLEEAGVPPSTGSAAG